MRQSKNSMKVSNHFHPISIIFLGFLILPTATSAANHIQDLKSAISEKSQSLQEINEKLAQTQKELDETRNEKQTLQKEVRQLNTQLNQLNLSIKAGELTLNKLTLEIESLSYEISDIRQKRLLKKTAISQLLKQIQYKDEETLLAILLKNQSLSENLSELESLVNLNIGLSSEVNELEELDSELSDRLDFTSQKRQGVTKEKKNLDYRKTIANENREERSDLLKKTQNQERIYQEQLSELEKSQAEISAEIEKIETELRKLIDPNLLPISRPEVLEWPVRGERRITQGYGKTDFTARYYRDPSKYHNGIDFGGQIGTEVFVAETGIVINAGNQDLFCPRGAYGKFVVIKHFNGLATLYAHLSGYTVSIGQQIQRGELIGYIGKTGWATGPHLHFTVFATNTLTPAQPGLPEGSRPSRFCGPMPVGGDLNPLQYL